MMRVAHMVPIRNDPRERVTFAEWLCPVMMFARRKETETAAIGNKILLNAVIPCPGRKTGRK